MAAVGGADGVVSVGGTEARSRWEAERWMERNRAVRGSMKDNYQEHKGSSSGIPNSLRRAFPVKADP